MRFDVFDVVDDTHGVWVAKEEYERRYAACPGEGDRVAWCRVGDRMRVEYGGARLSSTSETGNGEEK